MPRPNQCPECMLFEGCLTPSSPYCDEKLHGKPFWKHVEEAQNPIHESEREEYRSARESMSEMERAHDYDDTH